jgi:signal transduction histidine kinase
MVAEQVLLGTLRPRSRLAYWLGYLIIGYVTLRKLVTGAGSSTLPLTIGLLVAYTILLTFSFLLAGRPRWYFTAYLMLELVIIEALGLVQPYEDTWAILYISVGLQIMQAYPFRQALGWGGLICVLLTGTLIFTSGWIRGLGFSLYYIVIIIFFVAYDTQYARSEAARQESQELLGELETAHAKLKEYSIQAEELATIQEHNRLRRELHDSVSQILFSITMTTEATRMLLEKDSGKVPERLDRLQELTTSALSQMRALISQWREG